MDLKLSGKIALMTGSPAGIDYAIAQSLASEGARVYVNGRTRERVDRAAANLRVHPSRA
jgi:NAD(P)-dependent dehydrogenase (short-subunit alcohol dehydrogenase family)